MELSIHSRSFISGFVRHVESWIDVGNLSEIPQYGALFKLREQRCDQVNELFSMETRCFGVRPWCQV
jgi:hypothetical protein